MDFDISQVLLNEKFEQLSVLKKFKKPPEGWLKTICQALGMTSSQMAQKIGVTQPRIVEMQKNETGLKLRTMQKIADALGFEFVYALVPKTSLKEIRYNQAKKKAKIMLEEVNLGDTMPKIGKVLGRTLLESITADLLQGKTVRIWDED